MNIKYDSLKNLINKFQNFLPNIKSKYLLLLSELSETKDISDEVFFNNLNSIYNNGYLYIAYIGEPNNNNFYIIASGTIFFEPKIIRGGKNVGHIEDIVVLSSYRGLGISKIILNFLKEYGFKNNCYKLILDCKENICPVYEKSGFNIVGSQMSIYFDN